MPTRETPTSNLGAAALIAIATVVAYSVPVWAVYKWPAPAMCAAAALFELFVGVRQLRSKRRLSAWQHWMGALSLASLAVFFDWTRVTLGITWVDAANKAAMAAAAFAVVAAVLISLKSDVDDRAAASAES